MWMGFHSCSLIISSWNHLGKLTGGGFPDGSVVKNVCAMQETWVQSLGREDLLEKRMTTHSIILAQGIPWTEECGNLLSVESQSWTQRLSMHTQALTSFHWPQLADLYWILTLYFGKWKCCSIGLQMVLNLAFGKMTRMGGFHCNCWFTDCRKKSSFTFQAL